MWGLSYVAVLNLARCVNKNNNVLLGAVMSAQPADWSYVTKSNIEAYITRHNKYRHIVMLQRCLNLTGRYFRRLFELNQNCQSILQVHVE